MKQIPLNKGYYAKVSDSDYRRVAREGPWHLHQGRNTLYAGHTVNLYREGNRTTRTILLHRFVLGLRGKQKVDHRDLNGLNCQRRNLRVATNQENICNSKARKGSSSRYKGVYWHKKRGAWAATINTQGKVKHLGYFSKEVDAAKVYDVFAKKHFGRFAFVNFQRRKNVRSVNSVG